MRKKITKAICSMFLCVFALALSVPAVHADEPGELAVEVRTYDNMSVAVMPGRVFYSPVPVKFIPQGSGQMSYSISTDDGATFGSYIKMNNEDVMLYPDDDTAPEGRWQIRFKDGTQEEELLSGVYMVCFDMAVPYLRISNPEVISDHMTEEDTVNIVTGDDIGIGRIMAKCDDEVLYELHRGDDDEPLTEHEFSLDLKKADGKAGKVDVSCFDLAGNRSVVTFEYGFDDKENEITVQNDDQTADTTPPLVDIIGATDNVDMKAPTVITVDVIEENYEESIVDITLTRTTPQGTGSIRMDSYTPEAYRDMRTINITSDGQYRLDVKVRDGAGNTAAATRTFRLDSTAPAVSVSGIKEGEVTSDKSTLRFCAGELFYDSTIMTAVLERFENGTYTIVSANEHVMKAERDSMDIEVDREGRYRLTCTAADRTGNSSSTSVDFTVDYTPPVISGVSELNNRFFRSFALPGKISDLVRDFTAVSADAYINDEKINDNDVIIEDGKYVLTVLAKDEAGNVSEESATFVVDHTSPQIVLSGFDRNGNIQKGSMITVSLLEEGDRLESVRFNDRNVSVGPDNRAVIAVDDYGTYTLEIKAVDEAQNVTDTKIVTSCYMYGASFAPYLRTETVIRSPESGTGDTDVDLGGLFAGLIPVLGGTFGLTYRTYLRD